VCVMRARRPRSAASRPLDGLAIPWLPLRPLIVSIWRRMEIDSSIPQGLLNSDVQESIRAHRFAHQAMATVFEVICVHEDRAYVGQAAGAAFGLIDRIESELTCHRGSSDISRINRLRPGENTSVNMCTMECLLLARHFHAETGGAFDIALGSGLESVEIDLAESRVRIHAEKVRLDLGGIGKGYAIDRAAELLHEWEIYRAVVHGGFSSVLVLDAPPDRDGWPLTISMPGSGQVLRHVVARRQAWSASGIRKKDHIVNPQTGLPARNRPAVWVSGSLQALGAACRRSDSAAHAGIFETGDSPAAAAEAASTAFMIMSVEDIAGYCARHAGIEARLLAADPANAALPPVMIQVGCAQ
jgi:thiamine biosynthesis lipoprotein